MKKVYLVDSENVGDVWVPLLASSLPDEEVVVFYTQQSPHMGYENVRLLKETEKNPIFIKCFEGRNALDFQLVTELGYRLRADEECEYVIISTDTGFDAAVRYWSSQKKKVRRLNGKECFRQATGRLRRSGADIEKISMEESTKTEEVAAEVAEKTETETGFKMAAEQLAADAAELAQGAAGVPEDTELAEAAETTEVAAEETGAVSTQEDTVMESANEQPEKTRSGARRRRRRETRKQKVEVAEAETEAAELSSEAKTSQEEAAPPEADA
ncbi:MAG: hypothetical protein J6C37_01060, partial [Roseburia sp.]|nr:hypothetical protein [Roseburia sp.]